MNTVRLLIIRIIRHYCYLIFVCKPYFALKAKTTGLLYKQRWYIEIFFKNIKQNLRIKSFIVTSKNTVLIQIRAALIKPDCAIEILIKSLLRTGRTGLT